MRPLPPPPEDHAPEPLRTQLLLLPRLCLLLSLHHPPHDRHAPLLLLLLLPLRGGRHAPPLFLLIPAQSG